VSVSRRAPLTVPGQRGPVLGGEAAARDAAVGPEGDPHRAAVGVHRRRGNVTAEPAGRRLDLLIDLSGSGCQSELCTVQFFSRICRPCCCVTLFEFQPDRFYCDTFSENETRRKVSLCVEKFQRSPPPPLENLDTHSLNPTQTSSATYPPFTVMNTERSFLG